MSSEDNESSANEHGSNDDQRTNPFDPIRLRLSQRFSQGADVERKLVTVPVRKANPQEFFRVHADEAWRLDTALIEIKADREMYLVDPEIWPLFPNECKPRTLYTTIDRRNVVTLWPVRLPDERGRLDEWNQSAHQAAQLAMTRWVRMSANMSLGAYNVDIAMGDFPDPIWPEEPFEKLLEIAFKGKVIEDLDHPVLLRLRGKSDARKYIRVLFGLASRRTESAVSRRSGDSGHRGRHRITIFGDHSDRFTQVAR